MLEVINDSDEGDKKLKRWEFIQQGGRRVLSKEGKGWKVVDNIEITAEDQGCGCSELNIIIKLQCFLTVIWEASVEETLGLVLTATAELSKYKNRMGSIVPGQDDVLGRTVCSVSENREERRYKRRGKGKSGEPQKPV